MRGEMLTQHRLMFRFKDEGSTILDVSGLSSARQDGKSLVVDVAVLHQPVTLAYEDPEGAEADLGRLWTAVDQDAKDVRGS